MLERNKLDQLKLNKNKIHQDIFFCCLGSGLPAVQAVLLQPALWGEHPRHPVGELHIPLQLKVLSGTYLPTYPPS